MIKLLALTRFGTWMIYVFIYLDKRLICRNQTKFSKSFCIKRKSCKLKYYFTKRVQTLLENNCLACNYDEINISFNLTALLISKQKLMIYQNLLVAYHLCSSIGTSTGGNWEFTATEVIDKCTQPECQCYFLYQGFNV